MVVIKKRPLKANSSTLTNIPDFLENIYNARGITNSKQLELNLANLVSYNKLDGIDKACARLALALKLQQKILIVGDFDADGATSSALAIRALKAMGAKNIDFIVPNRFEFGYGLTPELVAIAQQKNNPDLIITVDNGITSIAGVAKASSFGIDVIITDHHLSGTDLPEACAIINPNQTSCNFPCKATAGVGVIFYTLIALRSYLKKQNWFIDIPLPNMSDYLDLVALGTIADVVSLDTNNRILIQQGLLRIRAGRCSEGIKALIKVAKKDISLLSEADLAFGVAPRLNAAGRIDDMALGINCLISDSSSQALLMAEKLSSLNEQRRLIENKMKAEALQSLAKLSNKVPLSLCLYEKSWHQGVIGIIAGRIKDKYHRPAIVFANESENFLKGSARSINGLNIRDILALLDKNNPGLILKFGGHAMAAGLLIKAQDFSLFQQLFLAVVEEHISPEECEGVLLSDGELHTQQISLETANIIKNAGPWGHGFPMPVFDANFEIITQKLLKDAHLKLTLQKDSTNFEAIFFNIDREIWPNESCKKVHAAYKLDINIYRGCAKLQLLIQALNPHVA